MRLDDISIIGWLHTLACLIAMALGALVLIETKGTARHRTLGRGYIYSMFAANLSAFAIYTPVPGVKAGFGIFHWLAVATLAAVLLAAYAAPRQKTAVWAYIHPCGMAVSYYLLIGGAINEAFARITPLRTWALAHTESPLVGSPLLGMTQAWNTLLFAALLIYFLVQVARRRTSRSAARLSPSSAT